MRMRNQNKKTIKNLNAQIQIAKLKAEFQNYIQENPKITVVSQSQKEREQLFKALDNPEAQMRVIQDQMIQKQSLAMQDANIMMEGPLDHGSSGSPSERFMQLYINPYKLAILARFTAIGNRLTFEVGADAWANGLGVNLKGESLEKKNEDVNNALKDHFRAMGFIDHWKTFTGFYREQGDALLALYFEGETAAEVGTVNTGVNIQDFSYMATEAPKNKQIVKIEAFSRQQYNILRDDGRGNPLIFQVNKFLGVTAGVQLIHMHRSRVIWLQRGKINNDFTGQSVLESVYNECVIGTVILKAMGEVAFRWGYGHPVFLTKGLSEATFTNFKNLIGNPTREAWHILPSEWIESVEMLSNATGTLDLPALLDTTYKSVSIGSGVPKAILESEFGGVDQGGKVYERGYFNVLDKVHTNLEPGVFEFFTKDLFITNLLGGMEFDFNWGLKFSMSAEEKVNYDVKDIGNDVTQMNYMTMNEVRGRKGLPSLESVVDNESDIKQYAKYVGNSVSTVTMIDKIALDNQIAMKKAQAGKNTTSFKTTVGNDGDGKGEGVPHGAGKPSQNKEPASKRNQNANAASRSMAIKNAQQVIGTIIKDLHEREDHQSVAALAKELEMGKDKLYKMEKWKDIDVETDG